MSKPRPAGVQPIRELAKFHFTRNLFDAMALIGEVGALHGFSQEDLAYCDLSVFREMHVAAVDVQELLATSIEQGRKRHRKPNVFPCRR